MEQPLNDDNTQQFLDLYKQVNTTFLNDLGILPSIRAQLTSEIRSIFSDLYDTQDEAVYVFDITATKPGDYFVYINNSLEKYLGYTKEQFYTNGVELALAAWKPDESQDLLKLHEHYFESLYTMPPQKALLQKIYVRSSFRHKNGSWVDITTSIQPVSYFAEAMPSLFMCCLHTTSNGGSGLIRAPIELIHARTKPFSVLVQEQKLPVAASVANRIDTISQQQAQSALASIIKQASSTAAVHDEDTLFVRQLQTEHPDLTTRELEVCVLLRRQLRSKDIALLLGIGTGALDNYRSSIRRKLKLDRSASLSTTLLRY